MKELTQQELLEMCGGDGGRGGGLRVEIASPGQ